MLFIYDEDLEHCEMEGNILIMNGKRYKVNFATNEGIYVTEILSH